MGHNVTALLGSREVLGAFAARELVHPPVAAGAGLWLLPLTDEALDKIAGVPAGRPIPGFAHLSPELLDKLQVASAQGWIVYVETDYFGGTGRQGAVTVRGGKLVSGPKVGEAGCINQALGSVGVKPLPPAVDEFESVGLNIHRYTEDWLPEGEAD